jgi:hypothetical protein
MGQKMEELLYVMRRDQEGRECQGLRTVFKPLKEWYGKTYITVDNIAEALTISHGSAYSILL